MFIGDRRLAKYKVRSCGRVLPSGEVLTKGSWGKPTYYYAIEELQKRRPFPGDYKSYGWMSIGLEFSETDLALIPQSELEAMLRHRAK